jgi:predicted lipid-binding transport protein (Tim44 family)
MAAPMLQPPHIRARRRFIRRYLGPMLAGLIIGVSAFYYFGAPARPAAASVLSTPSFRNCAAARAAGAAPVRRGQPGYAPHLDADNDGVGCEPYPS